MRCSWMARVVRLVEEREQSAGASVNLSANLGKRGVLECAKGEIFKGVFRGENAVGEKFFLFA